MWKIVQELNKQVIPEYRLSTTMMKIDIFIPDIQCGVEVKLDRWTKPRVQQQVEKYELILGENNVLVVSPNGKYQYTVDSLIETLKIRLGKQF